MKQKTAKCAINEFGYLVNAADFRFQPPGHLYCFHCAHPVALVPAKDDSDAHFRHGPTMPGRDEMTVCPNLEMPQTEYAN
ncbi:hypothetical protein [Enterobacter cancerogenus]|uniref:hypothetical protein n=1 Tax=Enterobacter cancerogenus TaxID=69218 RepID=UPI0019295AA9|nr:hypothetical protein [Enterobacter cancerogenus]